MKKSKFFVIALAAVLIMTACAKEEKQEEKEPENLVINTEKDEETDEQEDVVEEQVEEPETPQTNGYLVAIDAGHQAKGNSKRCEHFQCRTCRSGK